MKRLDGRDLQSALGSLAAAAAVATVDLSAAMRAYDETRLDEGGDEPPSWRVPREVFAELGVDVDSLTFESFYCFHGTRVLDPSAFVSRGVLPLDDVIDDIWEALYALVQAEQEREEWDDFRRWVEKDGGGDWGRLYRSKTTDRREFGPHGTFVREVLLTPGAVGHDYLGNPEIVEDITRSHEARYGGDLEDRFHRASVPCIVTFPCDNVGRSAIAAAFWLVYDVLREGTAGLNANGGVGLNGRAVLPGDIVALDLAEAVPGEHRRYRLL